MNDKRGPKPVETETTRRSFVVGAIGGVTAAALSVACGGDSDSSNAAGGSGAGGSPGGGGTNAGGTSAGGTSAGGTSAGGTGAGGSTGGTGGGASCTVYPEEIVGPFYLDLDLVRTDITEGKPGTPFALTVIVQTAVTCAALKNVAVDIWQCDVGGVYSGFAGQVGGVDTTGQKFLRGTQITGDDGSVKFQTIYPGWYPGRTTHIHFKVHTSATAEAVSQLYFPEETTTEVYNTAPYDARGQKDTSNVADGAAKPVLPPLLEVTKTATGYEGTLTIYVAAP